MIISHHCGDSDEGVGYPPEGEDDWGGVSVASELGEACLDYIATDEQEEVNDAGRVAPLLSEVIASRALDSSCHGFNRGG